MIDFAAYRTKYQKYLPDGHIRCLLIAESPPRQDGEVPFFFYYDEDDVRRVGGLFKNTMTARYEPQWHGVEWRGERIPGSKRGLLERFSRDGFYLIDETDRMIAGLKGKKRPILEDVKVSGSLKKQIGDLAKQNLVVRKTRIAFISYRGYDVFFDYLKNEKISVEQEEIRLEALLIDERTPLPYHGNEGLFREFIKSL